MLLRQRRGVRRLAFFMAVFIYLIFRYFPSSSKNGSGKVTPKYDVETTPRFLYRSTYRETPDLEYERGISNVLQAIEQGEAQRSGDSAQERIWQIMLGSQLGSESRVDDSIELEDENSEWDYTLVDDATGSTLISDISAKVPDIQTLYDSHPSNIVRADLLRYILLWYYGGFYADMDVFPAREIKECPALEPFFDETSKTPDVSLVVGIEIDEPRASPRLMKNWRWARNHGFIQYAIYAPRPFSPILREAIIRVLSHNRHHTKTSFFRPQYNERTILDISGPGMFTDVTLDVLSQTLPSSHQLIDSSVEADEDIGDLRSASGVVRRVTWAPFHKIRDPLCVAGSEAVAGSRMGGLCVLPVSVWGNGQRHSGAEGFSGEHACLNHRFKGTWKKKGWRGTFGN